MYTCIHTHRHVYTPTTDTSSLPLFCCDNDTCIHIYTYIHTHIHVYTPTTDTSSLPLFCCDNDTKSPLSPPASSSTSVLVLLYQ